MDNYISPDINLKGFSEVLKQKIYAGNNNDFPYSGLWIFSGAQGSGKTLLLMETLKQMYEEYPEILIVSNISIYGIPSIPYTGIEDFTTYNNGRKGIVFVIDEIQTLFNSLESNKMPASTLQIWSQNRKNSRVILGTSQRFNRVAKGLREQTKYLYECRRGPFGIINRYRLLDASKFDDNGRYVLDEDEKMPHYSFYIPHVSVMRMYDTREIVINKGVEKE